jgi:hypothetical protein
VQLRPPQRLVGIDVADSRDQTLVEQGPFEPSSSAPKCCVESVFVEFVIEDVARNVGDLGWQLGATDRDREAAERALIDEAQLQAVVVESDPHSKMRASRNNWVEHQQLSAHSKMSEHRVTGIQRQPEVLSAATGAHHPSSDQAISEVCSTRHVTPDRAWMQDLDRADLAADHPALEAAADGLDLGKFGHFGGEG